MTLTTTFLALILTVACGHNTGQWMYAYKVYASYSMHWDNFIFVQLRIVSVLTLMERTVCLALETQGMEPLELKWIQSLIVIIKSYKFHCCGRVDGWAAYVEPAGGGGHTINAYSIKFQIWRPMGDNRFV